MSTQNTQCNPLKIFFKKPRSNQELFIRLKGSNAFSLLFSLLYLSEHEVLHTAILCQASRAEVTHTSAQRLFKQISSPIVLSVRHPAKEVQKLTFEGSAIPC